MKVEITKEMVKALEEKDNEVRGTSRYATYYCECNDLTESGKSWHFSGWYLPTMFKGMTAKRYNGNWYAYTADNRTRFTLCHAVCNVWGLR